MNSAIVFFWTKRIQRKSQSPGDYFKGFVFRLFKGPLTKRGNFKLHFITHLTLATVLPDFTS